MTLSLLSGLFVFCLVTSITPGPNNLMLLAAGANFGVRRTLPHAAGVVIGFTLMIIIIGLGAAQIFQKFPVAHTVLTVTSIAYLLYLAFKIATDPFVGTLTFIRVVSPSRLFKQHFFSG